MSTPRIPPHSIEAEAAVLGSILIDADRVADIAIERGVTAESFYVPANRALYDLLIEMRVQNRPINLLTAWERAKAAGCADKIGGETYVEKLAEKLPTAAHAEYYVKLLLEKQSRREMINRARETMDACYDGEADFESIRSAHEYEVANLQRHGGENRKPRQILQRQIESWQMARSKKCAGVPTGFRILDLYFGGLMEGAFYIFSGQPGCGKTTLARNIAENLAMRAIPSGILTLEQTSEQIWGAIAARHARQSVFKLNTGNLVADVDAVAESANVVCDWPIHVEDRPQTITTLFSWARRCVAKHGCRLLIVDYIQSIRADRQHENDTAKITDFSTRLRDMAKELKTPILAISSLSYSGNLRGSGQLGYDAWAHLSMSKADNWSPMKLRYKVSFEKNRYGPPAYDEHLMLLGDEQRFEEEQE